jgi:hypothetical protein
MGSAQSSLLVMQVMLGIQFLIVAYYILMFLNLAARRLLSMTTPDFVEEREKPETALPSHVKMN